MEGKEGIRKGRELERCRGGDEEKRSGGEEEGRT